MQVLNACQNSLTSCYGVTWRIPFEKRMFWGGCLYPKIPNVHYNMVFLGSLFYFFWLFFFVCLWFFVCLFVFCLSEQKHHLSCFWPESKWWFFDFVSGHCFWFCSFNQVSVSALSGYTWTQFPTLILSIMSKVLLEWVFEGVSVHILLCSLLLGNATSDLAISSSNFHPEIPSARKMGSSSHFAVFVCVYSSESQTWASW